MAAQGLDALHLWSVEIAHLRVANLIIDILDHLPARTEQPFFPVCPESDSCQQGRVLALGDGLLVCE